MRNWELELALLNQYRDAATARVEKILLRDDFTALCEFAKVASGRRQARKYNQKRGAAWVSEPAFKADLLAKAEEAK